MQSAILILVNVISGNQCSHFNLYGHMWLQFRKGKTDVRTTCLSIIISSHLIITIIILISLLLLYHIMNICLGRKNGQ